MDLRFGSSGTDYFGARVVLTRLMVVSVLLSSSYVSAAEATYAYPELTVVPRASERLRIEAAQEKRTRFTWYIPIQASALATTAAAAMQSTNVDLTKDPDKTSATVGLIVGGGWIVTTLAMSIMTNPYVDGLNDSKKFSKASDQNSELLEERLAEEALRNPYRTARTMRWIAFATNLGASAYMLMSAQSDTLSIPLGGISLIGSFAPLLFTTYLENRYLDHEDYKKRIYNSTSASFFPALVPVSGQQEGSIGHFAPMMALQIRY